ncbi:MAG: hypothetical protein IH946_03590, partial [Bacteroidetes bacterium]|nr:hypothetical protein [Bacteroidota bacterium]
IEWNRIDDRESDCKWIVERYPNAKCFVVPNQIHSKLISNANIPMLEYNAKNIGIRKASNEWLALVNADVFIGEDIAENIQKGLNKDTVYGSHITNIAWDGEAIAKEHLTDRSKRIYLFHSTPNLEGVVGHFIMT